MTMAGAAPGSSAPLAAADADAGVRGRHGSLLKNHAAPRPMRMSAAMPPPTPPPMAAAFELEEEEVGTSLEGAYGKGVGEAVAGSDPPMHESKDHIAPGTVHVHAIRTARIQANPGCLV